MTSRFDQVPVLPAATILILRESPEVEVLMLHRHPATDFAPGALLFPGGKVSASDSDPGWAAQCRGWEAYDPDQRRLRIAAIREVFEETGLILSRDPLPRDFAPGNARLELRAAVESEQVLFLDVLASAGVVIDLDLLTPLSRWITPPVLHKRFDTRFFLARLPQGQEPLVDGREAVDLEWISPGRGLALDAGGKRNILLPTRLNLRSIEGARTFSEAAAIAARQSQIPVEPRVEQRGERAALVIDPQHGYGHVVEELPAFAR